MTELDAFIEDADNRLKSLLHEFNWDMEDLRKQKREMVRCSFDPSHILDPSNIEIHEENCKVAKEANNKIENKSAIFYDGLPGVVKLPQVEEPDPTWKKQRQKEIAFFKAFPPQEGGYFGVQELKDISYLEIEDNNNNNANRVENEADLKWYHRTLITDRSFDLHIHAPRKARSIVMGWRMLPNNLRQLNWSVVDSKKVKGWLYHNIEQYLQRRGETNEIETVNYIYSVISNINDPDTIVNQLYSFVGPKTRQMVRHMWKWALLEIHAFNYRQLIRDGNAPLEPKHFSSAEGQGPLDDIDDHAERVSMELKRLERLQPLSAAIQQQHDQHEHDTSYSMQIKSNNPSYVPLLEYYAPVRLIEQSKSPMELYVEQRNAKRRRRKYRSNTIDKKKTPLETTRELINLGMADMFMAAEPHTGQTIKERKTSCSLWRE